jgi:hypothetical protein
MDDWNAPNPATTTVNGPAPNHPSALTNPLAQARSFMDDIEAAKAQSAASARPRSEDSEHSHVRIAGGGACERAATDLGIQL